MTIDEIQVRINAIVNNGLAEQYKDMLEILEELKWYRSQDLISKQDAIERIENLIRLEKHEDHVITLCHSYCAVAEIPKVEPPKE